MSQTNYTPQRYKVLENVQAADNYGTPILAADFKTVIIDLEQSALNGDLVVYVSDQYFAPDVSQAQGPDNDYHEVGYTDSRDTVYYTAGLNYNPATSTPGGNGRFNLETTGARWVIACILDRASGIVQKLSVTLFNNQ